MHQRRNTADFVPAEFDSSDSCGSNSGNSAVLVPTSQDHSTRSNFTNPQHQTSGDKGAGRILSRPKDGSQSEVAAKGKADHSDSEVVANISRKASVAVTIVATGESISGRATHSHATHSHAREQNHQLRGRIIATRPGTPRSDGTIISVESKNDVVPPKGRLVVKSSVEKQEPVGSTTFHPPAVIEGARNIPDTQQRARKVRKDERLVSRPSGISGALISAIRNNRWSVGALTKGFDAHASEAFLSAAIFKEALGKRKRTCATYLLSCLVSFVCYGAVAGVMQPGVLRSLLSQEFEAAQARVSSEKLADSALSALSRISWGSIGSTHESAESDAVNQALDKGARDSKEALLAFTSVSRPRGGVPNVNREKLVGKVLEIIRRHGVKRAVDARLAAAIVDESKRQNYDPLFVAAVIKTESAFDANATSSVGAKGLMQIMPATGNYVASFADLQNIPKGKLSEPGYNLKLGIRYLRYLDKLNEGNRLLTLISYNWGPGKVQRTVEGRTSGVPPEVVNYALRILHDHQKWQSEVM